MHRRLALFAVLVALATGCDAANVQTQELIMETQDAIVQLRSELAIFQDEIDSLRRDMNLQDSLMRDLANQLGRPMPMKTLPFIPPNQ
jgi:hypothetical protein